LFLENVSLLVFWYIQAGKKTPLNHQISESIIHRPPIKSVHVI